MRATLCAALLALLLGACATTTAAHHGTPGSAHKRSTGFVRIRASLEGGPMDPKTHQGVLDNRPMRNVRMSVVSSDGRHWHGRTTRAGIRTFKLLPGRYVISSGWCGGRRMHVNVLAGARAVGALRLPPALRRSPPLLRYLVEPGPPSPARPERPPLEPGRTTIGRPLPPRRAASYGTITG